MINYTKNKLPLLGDLPFIGTLFQHRSTTLESTDLIIEITPRVVSFEDFDYDYEDPSGDSPTEDSVEKSLTTPQPIGLEYT